MKSASSFWFGLLGKSAWLLLCTVVIGWNWLALHIEPWGTQMACSARLLDPIVAVSVALVVAAGIGVVGSAFVRVRQAHSASSRVGLLSRWHTVTLVLVGFAALASFAAAQVCHDCGTDRLVAETWLCAPL